jgi:hypothetical protein
MRAFIRVLGNKLLDIDRALARRDFLSPKWYAYELGIQLERTEQEFELCDRSVPALPLTSDADELTEKLFSAIRGELERLRSCLVEQKLEAAQKSLGAICSQLAQLDACLGDA